MAKEVNYMMFEILTVSVLMEMNKNQLFKFFNFIVLPRRFGILKRPDKKKLTPPPLPFMFWLRRFMIETSKYYHVRMHIPFDFEE